MSFRRKFLNSNNMIQSLIQFDTNNSCSNYTYTPDIYLYLYICILITFHDIIGIACP